MSVWIVTAECGDYYCGCGVGHLLGVATSPDVAERIQDEGLRAEHSYDGERWHGSFHGVRVREIESDQLLHRTAQNWAGEVELRLAEDSS